MKLIALTCMLFSQLALADGALKCSSEPEGADNYSYTIEMTEGSLLSIRQQSRSARYAPLNFKLEPVAISMVGLESQRFVCTKTRSTEDGYTFTLRVTDNYLFLEQSSDSARYPLLAYKLLK